MNVYFDTIIIGTGPAGCIATYDLRNSGDKVLLAEKRKNPEHLINKIIKIK